MRPIRWTHAFALVLTTLAFAQGASLLFAQDDEAELEAERARVAKEALDKAVARGAELWKDKKLLGLRKSCASCHEDPEKPQLNMMTREFQYPAYSRRKRKVVTLQQKLNEMLKYQSKGKELAADSADLGALGAYLNSIRTK
jgi:cytochrome c